MANLTTVLDMVKVMAFALQEGKIAVHCHAGLGRTGTFDCEITEKACCILQWFRIPIVHVSPQGCCLQAS